MLWEHFCSGAFAMTSPRLTFTKSARVKITVAFDLTSDALPFGRLWYTQPDDAVEYAKFYSRSHHVVITVYDDAGNVIKTHEHAGDFKEP